MRKTLLDNGDPAKAFVWAQKAVLADGGACARQLQPGFTHYVHNNDVSYVIMALMQVKLTDHFAENSPLATPRIFEECRTNLLFDPFIGA